MRRPSAASSRAVRSALASATGALLVGAAAFALLALPGSARAAAAGDADVLTPSERSAILALGPWPPAPVRDDANPASGSPGGIALGESLFFGPRLSPTGLRCASCHEPWRHFADGRAVAQGVAAGSRNTPSLLDAARHRHYGWDGARDQLWQQSLRPLQDPREMPAQPADVAALMRGDAALSARYAAIFGAPPGPDDARVTRDVGRALAAYIETLATPRTPFDDWRDLLANAAKGSGPPVSDAFPAAARRGLRLFVGSAGCSACHGGPTLSDDAFHVSRVQSMTAPGVPDHGHGEGPASAFRTPGLRDVAATPPYFHDGSAARLCDAVRPHAADGSSAPPPLEAAQRRDLVAFLRTLSSDAANDDASACD
jgi:cytochrome c peroxidase